MPTKQTKFKQKLSRPENLDKRVLFRGEESEDSNLFFFILENAGTPEFLWSLELNMWTIKLEDRWTFFSRQDFETIIAFFESEQFDWMCRSTKIYINDSIIYRYKYIEDAVLVANQVIEFAYKNVQILTQEEYTNQLKPLCHNLDQITTFYIGYISKHEYILKVSQPINIEILAFENKKWVSKLSPPLYYAKTKKESTIKRKETDKLLALQGRYNSKQAIQESNPDKKDGILLINYHLGKSEFHDMEWNDFCLMFDKARFTKNGQPIDDFDIYNEQLPKINQDFQHPWESFCLVREDYSPQNRDKPDKINDENLTINLFPDEIELSFDSSESTTIFREGATSKVVVNAYERNPQARKKCIEHYGESCFVCGFDFSKVFGELGKGFIHVHHLTPISEIREEYEINPIEDLRPVCPNCHAMIHRRNPLLSIEELQSILSQNQ